MVSQVQHQALPKQLDFFRSCDEVPFSAYIGGVGSGKTHVLGLQALRESAVPGTRGVIGAPSYRMLADVTRHKFFELCPATWIREFKMAENRVILQNNSEILFRSFDQPGPLQGLTLDWFGGDEIGLVKEDVFRMMQGRLRRAGGSHRGFVVGNPAGPTHWTFDYFVNKATEFPETYRLVQATSYENSFLEDAYTRQMEISYGKDSLYYRRFVMGEWVAFEGAYWYHFDIRPIEMGGMVCTMSQVKELLDNTRRWYYGKVLDFGFEHPWTMLWFVHDGETIVFFDEYVKRHGLMKDNLEAIKAKEAEHRKIFGPIDTTWAWTDHAAQDRAEIQNCRNEQGDFIGFQCKPAEKNIAASRSQTAIGVATTGVMTTIILVQRLIQQRRLFITTRCEQTRREVPSYRAVPAEKAAGKERPIKEHDDTCDCVRMACWMELGLNTGWIPALSEEQKGSYGQTDSPDALEQLVAANAATAKRNNLYAFD